jgi:transposase
MDTDTATTQAIETTRTIETTQDAWVLWQREHADVLARGTGPQRILLEAAVRFVTAIAAQPILLRIAAFFLLHAGMGLTPAQVGAAVGRTDRAMRTVQALGVRDVLDSIWAELGRHRQPKLHPEHAGPIAKYLVDHPGCTQPEVAMFIASELSIVVDTQTLRRFLDAYGLNVLRPDHHHADGEADVSRPPSSGAPTLGAPSSSCRPRSP